MTKFPGFLLILPLLAAPPGLPQDDASVLVRVSDESDAPVVNRTVSLEIYDGQRLVRTLEGETEDDGAVIFSGVPSGPGMLAHASVEYGGFPYRAEPRSLAGGGNVVVSLRVFNTTDAGMPLHIDMLHVVLNVVEPGLYQAIQVMSVRNVAEKAFYGATEFQGVPVGMEIPVPTGASRVTPLPPEVSGLDPSFLALDAGRLLDLRPVPPGVHQIGVGYELVTGPEGSDVELRLPYPTAQVSLLVGPNLDDVEIDAPDMIEQEPQEIPGQGIFAHWTSDVIDAGGTLTFHIGPRTSPLSAADWSLIGLGVALLAGVAGSIWGAASPAANEDSRRQLIEQVARLDRDQRDGGVSDEDYHRRRGEAIGRILEIDRIAGSPTESDR